MQTKKNTSLPLSKTADFREGKQPCSISIDWLQLDFRGIFQKSALFTTNKLDISTRNFKSIYEVFKEEWRLATIVNEPLSEIIPPEVNLIKMDNRELYWKDPVKRLNDIGTAHNLLYYCPSRLDICIDFNLFANGLHPNNLIKGFIYNKYRKKGHNNYTIIGKQKNEQVFDYIRFSKKTSQVATYLYNKSKEMRDVKCKTYIIKTWEFAGLDLSKDVWRLEFSIHSPKFNIIDKNTGDITAFNIFKLDDKNYLRAILDICIFKYFSFFYNTNTEVKNCTKSLKLFEYEVTDFDITFRNEIGDTGRGDILFLKKLRDLNNELRSARRAEAEYIKPVIKYFKRTRDL